MNAKLALVALLSLILASCTLGAEFIWNAGAGGSLIGLGALQNFKIFQNGQLTIPLSLPGANDVVVLASNAAAYTVTLDAAATFAQLQVGAGAVLQVTSTLTVSTLLAVNGTLNAASGTISMAAGAVLKTAAGATVTLSGTGQISGGTLENHGSVVVAAGATAGLSTTFKAMSNSKFTLTGNATMTSGSYSSTDNTTSVIVNGGLSISGSGAIDFQNSVVQGSGSVTGQVAISGSGSLNAGNSPGIFTVRGDLEMGIFSTMVIETNAVTPLARGIDHDFVLVTGKATLRGGLKLQQLDNDKGLGDGAKFTYISYSSSNVQPPQIPYIVYKEGLPVITYRASISYGERSAEVTVTKNFNSASTMTLSVFTVMMSAVLLFLF
jgi:hypothetical protein